MAQQIGQASANALLAASQASQLPATRSSNTVDELLAKASNDLAWLRSLPARCSDDDLTMVQAIIVRDVARLPACLDDDFAKYMRIMEATLKARNEDTTTGKVRLRAYQSRLGNHPTLAIQFMVQECVDTMIFFPTISECHDVLRKWKNPLVKPLELAMHINDSQWAFRFEDFREKLRIGTATQDEVDAVSERWKNILFEQGYLRFDVPQNRYVIRERKTDNGN